MAQAANARLVVTLPVYKDTSFLGATSAMIEAVTGEIEKDFTLLIAEDGSNSTSTVEELRCKYPNIVYLHHDQRLGRGKALRDAWNEVHGEVYVYVDVDMATNLTKLDAYRNLIRLQEEFDLVTGSRYLPNSLTNRPKLRRAASLVYNSLVCLLFHTGIHDHQCGFKSFSRRLVDRLAVEARSDSWFWDTEVIVLAKRMGFKVKEIPVDWVEKKGRRTPVKRLIRDVWLHGTGLLTLFYRVYFTDLSCNLS